MLHKSHRIPALLAAGALMLSLNSCGLMEMRDSYVETEAGEDSAGMMLAPAERVNQIIERPAVETDVPQTTEPRKDVKIVLAGDALIDTAIVKDAADRAYDGQSYSFLTMYTGIYGSISGGDASLMSFSTADGLSDKPEQTPPVEAAAALSDLGVDILDITGSDSSEAEKHGMTELNGAEDTVETVEAGDMTLAFTALDGNDYAQYTVDDDALAEIREADRTADVVIVSVTWNENTGLDEMRTVAAALADAGADVVAGKGRGIGAVEWIDSGDGTKTLAAYSLGTVLSTSDKTAGLLGGVLSFTVDPDGALLNPVLEPTFTHYTAEYRDYQVFRLAEYSDELAASHANSGVYTSVLRDIVRGTVPAEFLPAAIRG
ncbi:MAG: CapA family protein [Clostridia bacterium]|nr:CapA family protein [Clostridia bacterium]